MESSDKDKGHKKIPEVKIFPVPFVLGEIKSNITITTKTPPLNPTTNSTIQFQKNEYCLERRRTLLEKVSLLLLRYSYFLNFTNSLKPIMNGEGGIMPEPL